MKYFLLSILLTGVLQAQNIGRDLNNILDLVPKIKSAPDSLKSQALDEVTCLLAYYAGMPDQGRVYELASGAALLGHYSNNTAIREFLLQAGIASQLENHIVGDPSHYLEPLFEQKRSQFLARKSGSELFGPAGQVDLEQIRQSVVAPKAGQFDLGSASAAAGARSADLSPDALVNNALVGLSDFIAKRAQQELTYTFLERLREYLNANNLNYLFPETAGYLPDLDLLNYKAILPSIRRAFLLDLNAISFNLGNFLQARNVEGFHNPAVYNIFLVYRILDLELREVPIPDILSFTYGELSRGRSAIRSEIDLKIAAEQGDSPEYRRLLSAFGAYAGAVERLNTNFEGAVEKTVVEIDDFLNVILEVDMTEDELTALGNELDIVAEKLTDDELPLAQGALSANTAIVNSSIVTKWLNGEEAYEYYEAYPSLTKFDEFFGPNAQEFSSTERRAAGLRAVREILARRDALDVYRAQYRALNEVRVDLVKIRNAFEDAQRRQLYLSAPHALYRQDVQSRLDTVMANDDHPALRLLNSLVKTTPEGPEAAYRHLEAVEQRLDQWLETNNPDQLRKIAANSLKRRGLADFTELTKAIESAAGCYVELTNALVNFNTTQAGDGLYDAYQNLTTFETVFGVAQQTFFLLAESERVNYFLDKDKMSIFQTDAGARQLLAGIARERMAKVPRLGKINVTALVDFLLDFSFYLSEYEAARFDLGPKDGIRKKAGIRLAGVEFITGSLEALLSAPILQNPTFTLDPNVAAPDLSFSDLYEGFEIVPAVNAELKELFKLSQDGDYRYAIDNLLNLFDLLKVFPEASRKKERLERKQDELLLEREYLIGDYIDESYYDEGYASDITVIDPDLIYTTSEETTDEEDFEIEIIPDLDTARLQKIDLQLISLERRLRRINPKANKRFQENLFKYGTFMSDVVGANTPNDIQSALENVALPPGSSQIKRNRPSSIELGAYFGAAIASERLILPADETDRSLEKATTALSLFVPVGLSYSRQIGAKGSATLFASILDLGGITAFRLEQPGSSNPGRSSVERLPEFSLQNVVAPGLHLMYNFRRTPFTVGFGIQDGPSVRRYTPAGSVETRQARSVRFMVTGSVDVPIFRFGGG